MSDDASRQDALEMRLAYLDDGLNQLSDIIYEQARAIERLTDRCHQLEQHFEALRDRKRTAPADEAPPHY